MFSTRKRLLVWLVMLIPGLAHAETFPLGSCDGSDTYCEIEASDIAYSEVASGSYTFADDAPITHVVSLTGILRKTVVAFPTSTVDVSELGEGIYGLTLESLDTDNTDSPAIQLSIGLARPLADGSFANIYIQDVGLAVNDGGFADENAGAMQVVSVLESGVEVAGLADGVNTLGLRSSDTTGEMSPVLTLGFPIFPPPQSSIAAVQIDFVESFLDTDPGEGNAVPLLGPYDAARGSLVEPGLSQSFHQLGFRSVDTEGDSTVVTIGIGFADMDGDGVVDVLDAFPNNSLEVADLDGDNIGDSADSDIDGDGVSNNDDAFDMDPSESVDTDLDGVGNNADTDDDDDGLPDSYEQANSLDQLVSNVGVDTDGDGLSDLDEFAAQTNPQVADSDGDGLSDGDEVDVGLDPAVADAVVIEEQILATPSQYIRLNPLQSVDVGWQYDTSDGHASLGGLTLRVHFSNQMLRWDEVTTVLAAGFVSESGVQTDAADLDDDARTDRYVEFVWSDDDNNWPGSLPEDLLNARFTLIGALEGFEVTPINLSAGGVPERVANNEIIRYRLESTSVEVGLGNAEFSLDITGDGNFDPFSDGVIIVRYLLGYPVADIATDAELTDATRSRQEIFDLLEGVRIF